MKRAALILAALAAILTAAAAPVRTATENFVTNKIAEAVAAIPAPDFSTNNAALVETIQAKAPAPGNYATVSNRAMTAMQSHQSLWPAVEASTNYTDAATNAMASAFLPRSHSDGNDTATVGFDYGPGGLTFAPSGIYSQSVYFHNLYIVSEDDLGPLGSVGQYGGNWKTARQEVEDTIREKSLGGIWDEALQVWWTPRMRNGSLTYEATTNVNLNAEN